MPGGGTADGGQRRAEIQRMAGRDTADGGQRFSGWPVKRGMSREGGNRMGEVSGKRGEITVFLSMILLCMAALICVMLEAARTAGARCYLQTAANSSMDSLFSEYHRQLWQDYHLLGMEYRTQEDLKERYLGFLGSYLETENWYPMTAAKVTVETLQSLADGGGVWLEEEILKYMNYGIWDNLDIAPKDGEQLWADFKEAKAIKELSSSFGAESREAWKLEQALDKIYECLKQQREYYNRAASALDSESSNRFFQESAALREEAEKIPKLVKGYEKQAEKLKVSLSKMEEELSEKEPDLTDERRQAMEQGLKPYQSYIEEEGARRLEILALVPESEENLAVVEEVKSQVRDIEEYRSSLSEEDEDHSAIMWSDALSHWNQIGISGLVQTGKKDEEKKGWLENIAGMVELNLLELMLPPDRTVSNVLLDLTDAPSAERELTGETDGMNLVKRVLANEYCGMHFSNFRMEEKSGDEVCKQQYELEYLLLGGETDRENLAAAVKQLLMVREGMNLIHILSDSEKQGEARALAMVITGALGLAPLVEIMTYFIMGIWALGESIADVRGLLAGEKISIFKTRGEWTLSLEQLLVMGQNQGFLQPKGTERGLDYEGYLKLLLLLENSEQKYYRMMDIIQMNIRQKQSGFLIRNCGYRVDMKAEVGGKHVFFALPFVESLTESKEHGYEMVVKTQKAY